MVKDMTKKFSLRAPNLGSLVLGMLVGIFLTCLLVFAFSTSDITLKIPSKSTSAQSVAAIDSKPNIISANDAEPRFDFYTELANTSVISEIKEATNIKVTAPANVSKPKTLDLKSAHKTLNMYIVQAGSFKHSADADALKARLALNGLQAKIENTKVSNGNIWNRVILGPLKSEHSAKELQKVLKTLDIESIVILKPIEHQRG